ncbi:nitrile hydratase accessory protein [Roseovarius sp. CAU 1744]|uniref:nitrile hydratase accessory protein n=1 Tax=Roseovarius sp. CAU 1744 TaxID=3140368 RepID=UPI00325BE743
MNPLDQHREVIAQVRGAIPAITDEGPLFRAPWQTRIFALIVAMVQQGHFPWTAFQSRLAALIPKREQSEPAESAGAVEDRYFDCWLQAVEETLTEQGLLNAQDVGGKILLLRQTIADIREGQTAD